ncbi:hypothetical protein ACIQPT_27870 [Streptomyces sp. NPDC091289]
MPAGGHLEKGRTDQLLSYAGHDASVVSTRLPTAMMFAGRRLLT